MVPFDIAFVSSYWPFIVTFHISLRVSEILPLFCAPARHFFPPHLQFAQNFTAVSPCSAGNRWMAFGLRRAKMSG